MEAAREDVVSDELTARDCMEFSEHCEGPVEYRLAPPGTGRAFLRCESHDQRRWERYEKSDLERFAHSDVAPSWFDPTIAGERWDDDY